MARAKPPPCQQKATIVKIVHLSDTTIHRQALRSQNDQLVGCWWFTDVGDEPICWCVRLQQPSGLPAAQQASEHSPGHFEKVMAPSAACCHGQHTHETLPSTQHQGGQQLHGDGAVLVHGLQSRMQHF